MLTQFRLRRFGYFIADRGMPIRVTPVRVVVALVIGQFLLRLWVVGTGNFYWDDLILVAQANSLGLTADYLFQLHDGHFMPGGYFLVWATNSVASLNWPLVASVIMVLHTLTVLAVIRMIRVISGKITWGGVLALLFFVLSPLTFPAFAWWSAAINSLPFQLALALFITEVVLIANGEHAEMNTGKLVKNRNPTLALCALSGGLLFFEKSIYLVPIGFCVAVIVANGRSIGWKIVLRRCALLMVGAVAIVSVWGFSYFFLAVTSAEDTPKSVGEQAFSMLWNSWNNVIMPSFSGNPGAWERWNPGPPILISNSIHSIFGWLIFLTLCLTAGYFYRRAWVVIIFVVGYVALSPLPILLNRSGFGSVVEIAGTLRYFPDSIIIITAAIVFIFGLSRRKLFTVNSFTRNFSGVVAAVSIAWFTVFSLVSIVSFSRAWNANPTAKYLATVSDTLKNHRDQSLFGQELPLEILLPVAYPNNRTDRVFSGLRHRPQFSRAVTEIYLLSPQGEYVSGEILAVRNLAPSKGDCAHPDIDTQTDIPLDGPVINWEWAVELKYCANHDGDIAVSMPGFTETTVAVSAGLHRVFIRIAGAGAGVRVRPMTEGLKLSTLAGPFGGVIQQNK